jgi:hypothetical protein
MRSSAVREVTKNYTETSDKLSPSPCRKGEDQGTNRILLPTQTVAFGTNERGVYGMILNTCEEVKE